MKTIYLKLMLIAIIIIIASCESVDTINLNRPSSPTELMVSQGDTSVFMNWKAVENASGYIVVRSFETIAENLKTPEYIDPFGSDEPVEYRVYAVNDQGWRSVGYAKGYGYVAIPPGVLPRPPVITASDATNYKYCEVTWEPGRFATAYNLYRDDILIAENISKTKFLDTGAPTSISEYKIYSVNDNGTSLTPGTDMGSKASFFIDTYEEDKVGFEITPWFFRVPNELQLGYGIAYYVEGLTTVVTNAEGYNDSAQSLEVEGGRRQLLLDWGTVPEAGNYIIRVRLKKSIGGFFVTTSFGTDVFVEATGDWVVFETETGSVSDNFKFSMNIAPSGEGSGFIDDWEFEYVSVD